MMAPNQVGGCDHEAAVLLPWYVNGTLAPEERRSVDDHVAGCAVCARELVALRHVQAGLRRHLAQEPEPSAVLWQTVRNRIAAPAGSTDRVRLVAARARGSGAWAWVSDLLRPTLRPAWALAALGLMVVQVAVIVGLLTHGPPGSAPAYRTLSGPAVSGQPTGPRARLRVAFVAHASEQAIRSALGELHGTIVDGPSAAGLYVIAVPLGGDVKTPPEAVQALRGRSRVIRFAELASQ